LDNVPRIRQVPAQRLQRQQFHHFLKALLYASRWISRLQARLPCLGWTRRVSISARTQPQSRCRCPVEVRSLRNDLKSVTILPTGDLRDHLWASCSQHYLVHGCPELSNILGRKTDKDPPKEA
jgi:hypothetical protein